MAEEASSHVQVNTPSKTVQEMVTSGQESPERYIHKGSDAGTFVDSLPLMEIPMIDFGLLSSSPSSSSSQELEKLRSALSFWGCFLAINHGMEPAFLDKVREVGKQFFALPPEKKREYSREHGSIEGYGNDMVVFEKQTFDWNDRLLLTVSPKDRRQLRFWPQHPESFREILGEYCRNLEVIYKIFLKASARSLNLQENSFLNMCGGEEEGEEEEEEEEAFTFMRFNYFPPCPRPDLVLGARPHSDGSGLTFVLQDKEVEGLQFLKNNQWYRVPIVPQALVVNIGDQLEIMSNGIFKSAMHRVVTNSLRERISLAVFFSPNLEKEIEPVKGVVNEARPRLYKAVKNYFSTYADTLKRGRRPIEVAMI